MHYEVGPDLTFKYFSEWLTFNPSFADRLGYIPVPECPKVYLHGFGFQQGMKYQCIISMGTRIATARANFVNTTIIEMIPPEWDLVTDSHRYVTNKTNLTLRKASISSEAAFWSDVYGGNGSTLPNRTALWIVQINKRPAYDLVQRNLTTIVAIESQDMIRIEFATNLRSGVDGNQEQVQTERDQKVTFEVAKGYSRMFEVTPKIDTNGILSFKVWPYSFGNTRICVVLRDDGGKLFGGIDATEPRCFDLIVNPKYLGDFFSFAQPSLEILENSGIQVLDRFLIKSPMGLYKDILLNFSAAGDSDFFETGPFVSEFGRLTFKCYPYVYGTTTISVYLSYYNSSDAQTYTHHQDLVLNVTAVNNQPSFTLNESRAHIEIIENECIAEQCSFSDLIVSKYSGLHDLKTTSQMFDWDESDQKMTFQFDHVLDTVFESIPVMSIDGKLSFKLLPNVFGNFTLSLTLKDDGGTDHGGVDTSDPQQITISIKPRNNQPTFKIARATYHVDALQESKYQRIALIASQTWNTIVHADLNSSGYLSLCLNYRKHGTVTFQVSLQDNGGTANGGVDTIGPIFLTIRVEPVNQPPSFKVAALADFGANVLHLWTSSGQSTVEGFLVDILNGHADSSGSDLEAVQSHTFYIETDLAYFVQGPKIDANGTLTLEVKAGMSGEVNMSITMADDGRTDDGTVNPEDPGWRGLNVTQICKVVISDGYLKLSGAEMPGMYNWSERMGDAMNLSRFLGVGREYVRDGGSEYEVTVGSVTGLVEAYRRAYDAIEGRRYVLPSGRGIENVTLRRRNYGQSASLKVAEAGITVVGLEYDARHPLVREGFFYDIMEPENTTMDLDGNSVISLRVEAVRYKRYPEETSWRENEGDGGLFVEDKNVSRVSTNCHPICRNATLRLVQNPLGLNGVVEFDILLEDAKNGSFTVEVVLVLKTPAVVQMVEDDEEFFLQSFINMSFIGNMTDLTDFAPLTFQTNFTNRSAQYGSNSFRIEYTFLNLSSSYSVVISPLPNLFGLFYMQTCVSRTEAPLKSICFEWELNVIGVNDPPEFNLTKRFMSNEDEFCVNQYNSSGLLDIPVSPGNSWEQSQQMTFVFSFLYGDSNIFEVPPAIRIDMDKAVLTYKTRCSGRGLAIYSVILVDNGGWSNGGKNSTLPRNISFYVQPRNRPPTFMFGASVVTHGQVSFLDLLEDEPRTQLVNFTRNIARGLPEDKLEKTQSVSFQVLFLNGSEWIFGQNNFPAISSNGSLFFRVSSNRYGYVYVNVRILDDGGEARGGINRSDWKLLKISVLPVNDRPTFTLVLNRVRVNEAVDSNTSSVVLSSFAFDISPGPYERDQHVTFRVAAVASRVPSREPYPWSSMVGNLFGQVKLADGQLFVSGSNILISNSGTLSLQLLQYRNGEANFSCYLSDDGGVVNNGFNRSLPQSLSLVVDPVNQPPSFTLTSHVLELQEGSQEFYRNFAKNISAGMWDENIQSLTFVINTIFGPRQLFQSFTIDCQDSATCPSSTANLSILVLPYHFGNVTLNVSLQDPFNAIQSATLVVNVLPVNQPPSFRIRTSMLIVDEGSSCISDSSALSDEWIDFIMQPSQSDCRTAPDFLHLHSGLIFYDMGPLEGGYEFVCPPETACEEQIPVFNVTCMDVSPPLFSEQPSVDSNGTLRFSLVPIASGNVSCMIQMRDSNILIGQPIFAEAQELQIFVTPVNNRPHFELIVHNVTVLEDSPKFDLRVADNIFADGQSGLTETNQKISFIVSVVSHPEIFSPNGLPSVDAGGNLTFGLAANQFGTSNLSITVVDDGGGHNGLQGNTKYLEVNVLPVNNPPTFQVVENVSVDENSGFQLFSVVSSITPGPANEHCLHPSTWCQNQSLTFFVRDVMGISNLFLDPPTIDLQGRLSLNLTTFESGPAKILFNAVDDGGTVPGAGENRSNTGIIDVSVLPINQPPAFSCGLIGSQGEGSNNSQAVIYSRKNQGVVLLSSFIQDITTARGFPGRAAVEHARGSSQLSFVGPNFTSWFSVRGLEYSSDFVISPDKRHLYSIETERDSLIILNISQPHGQTFLDRLSNNQNRLRFTRLSSNTSNPVNIQGNVAVCGINGFSNSSETFFVSSTGCDPYFDVYRDIMQPASSSCSPACQDETSRTTVGLWNLNYEAMKGRMNSNSLGAGLKLDCSDPLYCQFERPVNSELCNEKYKSHIQPAGIRDQTSFLGAAVLLGPLCKEGFSGDWDRADFALSLKNFLVNDGREEGLQFDGKLNPGLVVSKDIDQLVDGVPSSSKLPLEEISMEVWFILAQKDINLGGLMSIQQLSPLCAKGWSLTYSTKVTGGQSETQLVFSISLEANLGSGQGGMISVDYAVQGEGVFVDWTQVVASYNRSHILLHVNGQLAALKAACNQEDCGNIVYPASYSTGGRCKAGATMFSIGAYHNGRTEETFTHVGAIKRVRVTNHSLSTSTISQLYQDASTPASLRRTAMYSSDYWVQLKNSSGIYSPTSTSAMVDEHLSLQLFGRFDSTGIYRLEFEATAANMSSDNCSLGGSEADGFYQTLICFTPYWTLGYRWTNVSVSKKVGGGWYRLWQKVCISSLCGYLPITARPTSWWTDSQRLLLPGMTGAMTDFLFYTRSLVFLLESSSKNLVSAQFCASPIVNASAGACDGLDQLPTDRVKGSASSITFSRNGNAFLAVANFWDGREFRVTSPIFQLDVASRQLLPLQDVQTDGARQWLHLELNGTDFLMVANFNSESAVYPFQADSDLLDEASMVSIPTKHAAAMTQFERSGRLFVAFASFTFDEMTSSDVYMLSSPVGTSDVFFTLISQVNITRAVDVKYFQDNNELYLIYASLDAGASAVYRLDFSSPTDLQLVKVQALLTAGVTSITTFYDPNVYCTLAKTDGVLSVLRWNGTRFLGVVNENTLPDDAAGGQDISAANVFASTVVTAPTGLYLSWMGGHGLSYPLPLEVYEGSLEPIREMTRPLLVEMSPDGDFLYVATETSRAILAFRRDQQSGYLHRHEAGDFFSEWTKNQSIPRLLVSSVALGFPLRGLSSMIVDTDMLYAASFLDSSIAIFSRNPVNGSLALLDVILASSARTGLTGLKAIFLSGSLLYAAGIKDQALSVWRKTTEGSLAYVDHIRNGERIPSTYHGNVPSPDELQIYNFVSDSLSNLTFTGPRDAANFAFDGRTFLALAYAPFETESSATDKFAGVVILAYADSSIPKFDLVQLLQSSQVNPGCLAFFETQQGSSFSRFLVVGNMFSNIPGRSASGVEVFKWDQGQFSSVGAVEDETKYYPSSLKVFQQGDTTFLAVSVLWDGDSYQIPSRLYRWNPSAEKFELVQLFPLSNALDVEVAASNNELHIIFTAAECSNRLSCLQFYSQPSSAAPFQRTQQVLLDGAVDSTTLEIDGELFVAIACREFLSRPSESPLGKYDGSSYVYKYHRDVKTFERYQTISGQDFPCIFESGMEAVWQNYFCSDQCSFREGWSSDVLEQFRGATSVTSFRSQGELYLVMAQSVCELNADCSSIQPQSTVLQWNKHDKKFGELLSLTDFESIRLKGYPVAPQDLTHHQFPLRLDIGRALRVKYVEFADEPYLLALSLSKGTLLTHFKFDQISGLQSPSLISSLPDDPFLYVVNEPYGQVSSFSKWGYPESSSYDFSHCPSSTRPACLAFVNSTTVNMNAQISKFPQQISGTKRVFLERGSCLSSTSQCTFINFHAANKRNELRCGAQPIYPSDAVVNPRDRAACQSVDFHIVKEQTAGTSDSLKFVPVVYGNGSLLFETSFGRFGSNSYKILLRDSDNSSSSVLDLKIIINDTNTAPTFVAYDIVMNEMSTGSSGLELVFATGVSAGSNETNQNITWLFSYSSPQLFSQQPILSFSRDLLGNLQGIVKFPANTAIMKGTADFSVRLADDGPSSLLTGDRNVSDPARFLLTVRSLYVPSFQLVRSTLTLEAGSTWSESLVNNIRTKPYDTTATNYHFQLQPISSSAGLATDIMSAVSYFNISKSGVGSFSVLADACGVYQSNILLVVDDAEQPRPPSFLRPFELAVTSQSVVELRQPGSLKVLQGSTFSAKWFEFLTVRDCHRLSTRPVTYALQFDNSDKFLETPQTLSDGTLSFRLVSTFVGVIRLNVTMSFDASVTVTVRNNHLPFELFVERKAGLPTFEISQTLIKVVQSQSPQLVPGYVRVLPYLVQNCSFFVNLATSISMFDATPLIDAEGNLRFTTGRDHGDVVVFVIFRFDDGVDQVYETANATISIIPQPRILSIFPSLVPTRGASITIRGENFAGAQESVDVFVGGRTCQTIRQLSPAELTCVVPAGFGMMSVSVNISSESLSRSSPTVSSIYMGHIAIAGSTAGNMQARGLVALAPSATRSVWPLSFLPSALRLPVDASHGVRAMASSSGAGGDLTLYLGGSFSSLGGLQVQNVAGWKENRSFALGLGVNGAVSDMCVVKGSLVVVGSFTKAMNQQDVVDSPFIASWDGSRWMPFGDGSLVFVGGRIEKIGDMAVGRVAKFSFLEGSWSVLGNGTGLRGGNVHAMVEMDGAVLIGGSFTAAGQLTSGKLVAWRRTRFEALGEIGGDVYSLAVVGTSLFLGGNFLSINGVSIERVARYQNGRFFALDPVRDGTVMSIAFADGCIYAGGTFTGSLAAWCKREGTTWTGENVTSFPELGPVYKVIPILQS
ncbi:hypothetical protein GUITHDRAFT_133265 [Guillardia theta CCMP2712]|uniref:IPT/TIG domain-containing protein n=1 Tax=Guillardia theta (strain CCMP2712) TaxID=905079 RepID=L1JXC3_GUITC|nr:hypothetical protein GUITHDRAFT_133265 [Guillardia theta CCMP2712]EKX52840.1 hypothetical protein GUITHDRAFT_133265 [Guillardia theta CCMP2712]|eukprot:XP_005839820.1 hypothetical protein GUITHDRAFT_133265 [Guillardia theta CCMP2712]